MACTWLHLSDFHLRTGDPYDRDVVLPALVQSVRRFRGEGRAPDAVFATGDLAFSGKPQEYALVTAFFDELLDGAGLGRDRLIVVPGNHDVDREAGIGLARTLFSREQADAYFTPGRPWPHLSLKQGAFWDWYADYFRGIRQRPVSTCGPVEILEVGRVRLGLLPINSALFCQDDHDHAQLWIGRRPLGAAAEELQRCDADLRVVLIHHPLDWLADLERTNIRAKLNENADVLLRGHLHDTDVSQVISRRVR